MYIDINSDVGEGFPHDEALMPYISSANIACGEHAGDYSTALHTVKLCKEYGVAVGAHPGFRDRAHFGRREINMSAADLYASIANQIYFMSLLCEMEGITLHHVKPHGALYNMAARDASISKIIVKAISYFKSKPMVYGLSNSYLISEAAKAGLKTAAEVFADRRYTNDGYLIPRSEPDAVITDENKAIDQALGFIHNRKHKRADTICVHGDHQQAVGFAKKLHETLKNKGVEIKAI